MKRSSIFLYLTQSCNLACTHCHVSAGPRQKHMSLNTFHRIIDVLSSRGLNDVRLTGGEPTINPDFMIMLDLLRSNNIAPRLITNGIHLMKMRSAESILDKISQCWISAYGVTQQQHKAIGGKPSLPLKNILDFSGRQAELAHWVGVSVLLTEVSIDALKDFLIMAKNSGVRHLRFLFAESSQRAAVNKVTFANGEDVYYQAEKIFTYLRDSGVSNEFDLLSLSNPFNFGLTSESGCKSCMLSDRHMWSISPDGIIYSCCFNIYNPAHAVKNIWDNDILDLFGSNNSDNIFASLCEGLNPNFWGERGSVPTCPISVVSLSTSKRPIS